MSLFSDIRTYWYHYFLQKALQQKSFEQKSIVFKQVKKIAILFQADQKDNLAEINKFIDKLQKEGKSIDVLAYSNQKETPKDFPFLVFGKKETDLFFRPKKEILDTFLAKEYDILINLDTQNNNPLSYLAALANAHLRVGPLTADTFCYDLMIDEHKGIASFLNKTELYLNKMTNERYATTTI